jgi:hypothetical protein
MHHRKMLLGLVLLLTTAVCAGAMERTWTKVPALVFVAPENDARIQVAREAVDCWNRIFSEIGTSFRLGPMMPSTAVPAEVLQDLSARVVGRGAPVDCPESVPGKHSQKMLCTSSEWHRACEYKVYIPTDNTVPPRSESKAAAHRYVEGERHAER